MNYQKVNVSYNGQKFGDTGFTVVPCLVVMCDSERGAFIIADLPGTRYHNSEVVHIIGVEKDHRKYDLVQQSLKYIRKCIKNNEILECSNFPTEELNETEGLNA